MLHRHLAFLCYASTKPSFAFGTLHIVTVPLQGSTSPFATLPPRYLSLHYRHIAFRHLTETKQIGSMLYHNHTAPGITLPYRHATQRCDTVTAQLATLLSNTDTLRTSPCRTSPKPRTTLYSLTTPALYFTRAAGCP